MSIFQLQIIYRLQSGSDAEVTQTATASQMILPLRLTVIYHIHLKSIKLKF